MHSHIRNRRPSVCSLWSNGLPSLMALATLVLSMNTPAAAQSYGAREQVSFDRPESWAMKYFSSVVMPATASLPTRATNGGRWHLGLELGLIPHLDLEQRTVGFNGLKEEDLNRSPVAARPQLLLDLSPRHRLALGLVPPVELQGMTPLIASAALESVVWRGGRASVMVRPFVMAGKIEGDLTCAKREAAFEPGTPENPFGCNQPSNDEMRLETYGLGLVVGREFGGVVRPTHLSLGLTAAYHDPEFRVNAVVFGGEDRTILDTDGTTFAITAQAGWQLGKATAAVELHYSPLDVQRPEQGAASGDDLLNLRFLTTYALGKGGGR